jgi:GMP synthase (glutamine-hydrolysing)
VKKAVALRHLAFEDLGMIERWLVERGWRVEYCDVGVDALDALDPGRIDLLAVLGGPIGADEDERYPFLPREVRIIGERLKSGRPLLGICLGAQLMARALGARVRGMGVKEIGYGPLELTEEGLATPLRHVAGQPVLHWHGDQFALPAGIPTLAKTSVCPHQAFMVGAHALALQFHLEIDARRIEQWLIGHTGELAQAQVATATLRRDAAAHREGLERVLDAVLSDWFRQMGLA